MDQHARWAHGVYPFSTALEPAAAGLDAGGYSIFLVGLRHRVHLRESAALPVIHSRRLRTREDTWYQACMRRGWDLHPYLRQPRGLRLQERHFAPDLGLSPGTHDALFGATFPQLDQTVANERLVHRRLDVKDRGCRREEPLLLTLAGGNIAWIGRPLQVSTQVAGLGEQHFGFCVAWADLWLFPDSHSFSPFCNAILACKVVPTQVEGTLGERPYRVGDLAVLNRLLRDLDQSGRGGAWLRALAATDQRENFWAAALRDWLGITLGAGGRALATGDAAGEEQNVLCLRPGDLVRADGHSDYVKVLTAARIATPAPDAGWDCPQVAPPLSPERLAREQAQGQWSGEQFAHIQAGSLGYPTLGQVLLYELASTGAEGSALGLDGTDAYRLSMDYLRGLVARCGIEIWAHWRGLALRDGCAFLAWHPDMPILRLAEERYYPLYLHTYYSQLRLHDFSEGVVEHELADLQHAREIRHAFMQFRNQFWFRETAVGFQGIAVAEALRAGLALDGLYTSVAAEIDEIARYVEDKASAGRQQVIALVVALIYPVSLLWDLKKDVVQGSLKALGTLPLVAGTLGLVVGAILLYLLLAPRISRWFGRIADAVRRKGW
ncbi:hypothetical protein [uncultured Thiodictyon sp.]|uniref:hypothetical protein n=1 Tax=uncultured Thiodictyon sp. TaxID=1846217 RepID=UPI0025FF512D|nr:hypothetical protein [uncultured Thiodictyon sp.]